MVDLPALSGKDVVKALKGHGYTVDRIRGSHYILEKDGMPLQSVPVHGNQSLRTGTLRKIIKDTGLTEEEFLDLL